MDLPPGWHLSIEDRPSPAARTRLGRKLGKHNRPHLHNPKWQWLGVFVREPDGNIAPGLAGSTYGDWLFVHDLWVRADLRRRGIGQELLRLAEVRARERGCHSACTAGNEVLLRKHRSGCGRRSPASCCQPINIRLSPGKIIGADRRGSRRCLGG